jgi:3-keto-disaccharide hydrolase
MGGLFHYYVPGFTLILLGLFGIFGLLRERQNLSSIANAAELKLPEGSIMVRFDFKQKGIGGWRTVDGKWTVEKMPAATSGKNVLVQRAVENQFNVVLAPGGPCADVDSPFGSIQCRAGKMLRAASSFGLLTARYYVIRANALEDNFRLYYYDQKRYQLATATVKPPALGQWHTLRVVAVGDRIPAYLNGQILIDHRDSRFRAGQIGLWTKSDSVTAFDDLEIKGYNSK